MKITYEYLKDPNHLADPHAPLSERDMVYCLDSSCETPHYIHNDDEVSNAGRWYCPEHITEERFAQMQREGF
jgi:hypothetical protein